MAKVMMAQWRDLLALSLQANAGLKHSTYLQLVTTSSLPRAALINSSNWGFADGTDVLQITTDSRSQKVEEIANNPNGEICWYFTESWEQYRIQGVLNVIGSSETNADKLKLRESAWFGCTVRARSQFIGSHPKLPRLLEDIGGGGDAQLDPSQGPVDTFCLLTVDPSEVDYLNLRENRRAIFKHEVRSNEWVRMEVNP